MQKIENASTEKLRGAYYTPMKIARFILQWGINGDSDTEILEPSCGDGVFLECIKKDNMVFQNVTAVEYETGEAEKARSICLPRSEVINADFHDFCLNTDRKYDLIVGNPPYIRYQYYDEDQQALADRIFKRAKLKRTKLTNAWVTFVVGCVQLLKRNGKLGFVLPSELLQVKYAQQLRKYLAEQFNKINIISFEDLVFSDIQQEVVLLLCEKNDSGKHLIEHIEVRNADGLYSLDPRRLKFPTKKIDFHSDKWTYYFLNNEELNLLEKIRSNQFARIGSYADVEVGITTGANDYFTVPLSIINMYQLEKYAYPMVGRSVQINSLCFTSNDWQSNVNAGAKAFLLVFTPNSKTGGNEGVKAYLADGEGNDVDKGYKTGIRDYWYVIPSIKVSDALFLRRNNTYPKFVLNEARAYTTDTMHRVFIHKGVNKKAFIASYYNSLSFAMAEILGRNFGGGCLELMPSEVSDIFLPYNEGNESLFDTIDQMLRAKRPTDEILDVTDEVILRKGYGFSEKEVALCRSIWHKIMNRRLSRKSIEKDDGGEVYNIHVNEVRQLNLFETSHQYPDAIVKNTFVQDPDRGLYVDSTKNVLVSLIKTNNVAQYMDHSAKIYCTGKQFPACVAIDKLYYFMPYIKDKGIRDLYLIKAARVGTYKGGSSDKDNVELRLLFEIEYLGEMFDKYRPVDLKIWHKFNDTTMSEILNIK